jgi:hypothetical protein
MRYKKIPIEGYNFIGMYPVYVEGLYHGHEPFKIVGIRQAQVELEGDYSAMNNTIGTEWFDNDKVFVVQGVCEEQLKQNGCQVHNLFCCGGGSVIKKHINYWDDLVDSHNTKEPQ